MIDTVAVVDSALIERISLSNAGTNYLLLEQGSKTEASLISTHCGGGAVNAAVSLARLGFDTAILAKTGSDDRAVLLRETLASENINERWLRQTTMSPTGASCIISAHDRNAAIFTFRGANVFLQKADIDAEGFNADLIYISTLSGASADLLCNLVATGTQKGATIAVNPGIRQIKTRFKALNEALPSISILALNRTEAEAFVRQAAWETAADEPQSHRLALSTTLRALEDADEMSRSATAQALLSALRHLGASTVLMTDGKHGAYASRGGVVYFCPSVEVSVVSTAGAGDAFASTFAGMTVMGSDVPSTLIAATLNAASVVQHVDTQSGLLSLPSISQQVQQATLAVERFPLALSAGEPSAL